MIAYQNSRQEVKPSIFQTQLLCYLQGVPKEMPPPNFGGYLLKPLRNL